MQQPLHGGNPRACRLYLVPYPRPVNWWGQKVGRALQVKSKYPRPAAPEDLGARVVSPGTTLPRTPAPHITKSRSTLPASSPSWGPAPTTPTPVAPCVVSPTLGTPGTGATNSRYEPEVTSARSLTLTIDDAIKGRRGGITGCPTDR
jgi:hypothetical protein